MTLVFPRFASEVAGCEDLGTTGRGNNMQVIGFVLEKDLHTPCNKSFRDSNLSDEYSILSSRLARM